ncbi:MAG: hypothetical protein ACE366_31720 [Bradymonadia bacterium]
MDESKLVDWYDIIEAIANGRLDGHTCPNCGHQGLEISHENYQMSARCPNCNEGFSGRGGGRDDAYDREAAELMARQSRRRQPSVTGRTVGVTDPNLCPPVPGDGTVSPGLAAIPARPSAPSRPPPVRANATLYEDPPGTKKPERRGEPWAWQLPHQGGEPDPDALALWMPLVESIHNGRRTGLTCPFCSEPLHDIHHQPPHLRIVCRQCGEAFEGRIG